MEKEKFLRLENELKFLKANIYNSNHLRYNTDCGINNINATNQFPSKTSSSLVPNENNNNSQIINFQKLSNANSDINNRNFYKSNNSNSDSNINKQISKTSKVNINTLPKFISHKSINNSNSKNNKLSRCSTNSNINTHNKGNFNSNSLTLKSISSIRTPNPIFSSSKIINFNKDSAVYILKPDDPVPQSKKYNSHKHSNSTNSFYLQHNKNSGILHPNVSTDENAHIQANFNNNSDNNLNLQDKNLMITNKIPNDLNYFTLENPLDKEEKEASIKEADNNNYDTNNLTNNCNNEYNHNSNGKPVNMMISNIQINNSHCKNHNNIEMLTNYTFLNNKEDKANECIHGNSCYNNTNNPDLNFLNTNCVNMEANLMVYKISFEEKKQNPEIIFEDIVNENNYSLLVSNSNNRGSAAFPLRKQSTNKQSNKNMNLNLLNNSKVNQNDNSQTSYNNSKGNNSSFVIKNKYKQKYLKKFEKLICSTLSVLLDVIELFIANKPMNTARDSVMKTNANNDNVSYSIDIFDSYNCEEDRRTILSDQIQSILISKLKFMQSFSGINLDKEIAKIRSWNGILNKENISILSNMSNTRLMMLKRENKEKDISYISCK